MSGDQAGNKGGPSEGGEAAGSDAVAGAHGQQPSVPPMPPAPPPMPPGPPQGGPPPAWQQQPAQPGPSPFGPPAPPASPYGQPAPHGWNAPPPPPAPARRGGARSVVAVLAVLVVIAGVLVAREVTSGGDDDSDASKGSGQSGQSGQSDPSDPPADALGVTWKTTLPESHTLGSLNGLPALWSSTRNPVYADDNGVRAFDEATGKKLWTVATPKGASEVCSVGAPNPDGVAAVAFDAGGNDCSYLVAFDTETGRTLWSRNLAGDYPTNTPRIQVNRRSVVASMGHGLETYSITGNGAKDWTLYARGHDCGDDADWSGDYLVVSSSCSDAKPEHELTIRDLQWGDDHPFPGDSRDVQLVAGDNPLTVVFQGKDDDSPGSVQTYDDDFKPQKAFTLSGPLAKVEFAGTTFVDSDSSVMVTAYKSTTGACAVDLKTGKLLWSREEAIPLGVDSGQVIAVIPPAENQRDPRLVSIGLLDGKQRVLGTLYTPKHEIGPLIGSLGLSWSGSTLYVTAKDYYAPNSAPSLYAFDAGGKLND